MRLLKRWLENVWSATNMLKQIKKPLLLHSVPLRPWYKVGADYFTLANQDYLLLVDYFSKYPEVVSVQSKTADSTIREMKSIFARYGIPNTVMADNMPFSSNTIPAVFQGMEL